MSGSIVAIGRDDMERRLHASWRPGCPIDVAELRLLDLEHYDLGGSVVRGEMVVHADVAADVIRVFDRLLELRFPVAKMSLIDAFDGDDDRAMSANNTSAFNCRTVAGTEELSEHSWGLAIDLNPAVNPYVLPDGTVLPPGSERYFERDVPGQLHSGDAVVEAFAEIGWSWGGEWDDPKDHHHFSASGR